MQYGIELPNQGVYGNVHTLVELAALAEQAGWDGVFIWDCLLYGTNEATVCDPWIALACIAEHTQHLRFGALMTPLSRRRPWNVARQTVTLDHLSHGRCIVGVSIGDLNDRGFTHVGEMTDAKVRAEMLDEGLEVLMGLWSGRAFSYNGKHYQVQEMTFLPSPVQSSRIPIWVGGYWPNKRPMRRAARFDGVCPGKVNSDGTPGELTLTDVQNLKKYISSQRTSDAPFDIVIGGQTSGDDPEQAGMLVSSFARAGATWWLESAGAWPDMVSLDSMRVRIGQGPPRIDISYVHQE
jgi:Luciferase-like monooxygenase